MMHVQGDERLNRSRGTNINIGKRSRNESKSNENAEESHN